MQQKISTLSKLEQECGRIAALVVSDHGDKVSFMDYDKAMESHNSRYSYFAPMNWASGWGTPGLLQRNNNKMCALAAIRMGLIKQTEEGYAKCQS